MRLSIGLFLSLFCMILLAITPAPVQADHVNFHPSFHAGRFIPRQVVAVPAPCPSVGYGQGAPADCGQLNTLGFATAPGGGGCGQLNAAVGFVPRNINRLAFAAANPLINEGGLELFFGRRNGFFANRRLHGGITLPFNLRFGRR